MRPMPRATSPRRPRRAAPSPRVSTACFAARGRRRCAAWRRRAKKRRARAREFGTRGGERRRHVASGRDPRGSRGVDPLELVSLIAARARERCEAHPHGDGARAPYRAARRGRAAPPERASKEYRAEEKRRAAFAARELALARLRQECIRVEPTRSSRSRSGSGSAESRGNRSSSGVRGAGNRQRAHAGALARSRARFERFVNDFVNFGRATVTNNALRTRARSPLASPYPPAPPRRARELAVPLASSSRSRRPRRRRVRRSAAAWPLAQTGDGVVDVLARGPVRVRNGRVFGPRTDPFAAPVAMDAGADPPRSASSPEYYAGLSIARNGDPPQHDRRALPGLGRSRPLLPPPLTPAQPRPPSPTPGAGEAAEGRERRQLRRSPAPPAPSPRRAPRRDRERDDG